MSQSSGEPMPEIILRALTQCLFRRFTKFPYCIYTRITTSTCRASLDVLVAAQSLLLLLQRNATMLTNGMRALRWFRARRVQNELLLTGHLKRNITAAFVVTMALFIHAYAVVAHGDIINRVAHTGSSKSLCRW